LKVDVWSRGKRYPGEICRSASNVVLLLRNFQREKYTDV
jgi:hypothetical protein